MVVVTSSICEMAYMVDLPINCLCFQPSLVKLLEIIELHVLMYHKHALLVLLHQWVGVMVTMVIGVMVTIGMCDCNHG